jgi:glycosyltransferase involved in cell wall biosynthesis
MLISIIIPCYNEANTIEQIVNKILSQKNINKEIILVNDGSNDGSEFIINDKLKFKVNKIINHPKNLGKGASIKSGIKYANGEIILIQDADLEYDPINYYNLVDPIVKNQALVVYGSRVLNKSRYINAGFVNFYRVFFNHILTILSNFINNQKLTDAHTCYKVFKRIIFDKINLLENDFSFCPEVTTKIANLGYQIKEVEISYKGRNYNEGKKINLYDGVKAIYVLFKYGIFYRYFN